VPSHLFSQVLFIISESLASIETVENPDSPYLFRSRACRSIIFGVTHTLHVSFSYAIFVWAPSHLSIPENGAFDKAQNLANQFHKNGPDCGVTISNLIRNSPVHSVLLVHLQFPVAWHRIEIIVTRLRAGRTCHTHSHSVLHLLAPICDRVQHES